MKSWTIPRGLMRTCGLFPLLLTSALMGVSCSDDSGSNSTVETSVEETTPNVDEQATPLDAVRAAVIRIETSGAFTEPAGSVSAPTEMISWGGGSGFIIDESGIAVTNDHVVSGAADIEVYVDGRDEPVSARLLGSSSCNDLAVIDLDGDGYPTLDWYDGEIEPGLEIRLAGFPLLDPEYTLLDGIVAKQRTGGETPWASVEWVIEHTAPSQPGNSGGPLVTLDGEVVAVNYDYGQPGTGTSQHFAIAREVAVPVVETLSSGTDEAVIGVSAEAVVDDEAGVAGIWVSSVHAGAPAEAAGVLPGDIIERLEGLPVGNDGTLDAYCNVLRSHESSDAMTIQVLRLPGGERLRGTLNGSPLAPIVSIGEQVDTEVEFADTETTYDDYVLITDDTLAVEVEVPASWTDINGDVPFSDDDGVTSGVGLQAAPDLTEYFDTWTTPGMGFSATYQGNDTSLADVLDVNVEIFSYLSECSAGQVQDYDDGLYTGLQQFFTDCGGTETAVVIIVAEDDASELLMFVKAQIPTAAELDVLDHIIETFRVVGPVGTVSDELSGDLDVGIAPEEYSEFVEVLDITGTLGVEVPIEWADVRDDVPFVYWDDDGEEHGVGMTVSTDANEWYDSWGVPGMSLSATSDWNGSIEDFFYYDRGFRSTGGWFARGDCVEYEVTDYDDPLYSGLKGVYTDCGGGDTDLVVVVAAPPGLEFVVLVGVTIVTDADFEALDRILATFQTFGDVPGRR